jgi:hypothetical protein
VRVILCVTYLNGGLSSLLLIEKIRKENEFINKGTMKLFATHKTKNSFMMM